MGKRKVLILGKLPPPYIGPAIATQVLINSKLNEYFELIHFKTNAHNSIAEMGKYSIKKIYRNFKIYFELFSFIEQHKPDLILIPFDQSNIGFLKDSILIIISSLFKNKLVLQLRGSNFNNWINSTSAFMKKYVHFVLKKGDGIIVLGNKLFYLFNGYYEKDKIFAAPNGGDYKFPEKQKNNGKIELLYLGNLQPTKGIEDVIDALDLLGNNLESKVNFKVIGAWRDKETEEKCLNKVKKKNLPIQFLSQLYDKDKFQALKNADIFIFTPRAPEGHPWVIVEALAAGLPIITTDQGAITESVIDNYNGFIVEPKNPKQIAEKLQLLLNNKELRIQMGNASKKHYIENFTEEKMVEKYVSCFNKVLNIK